MGLDMMLYRMPRYKNTTAKEVDAIENYLIWMEMKKKRSEYANYTLQEWCGIDESELPNEDVIRFYSQFCDTNEYGYIYIMDEVGYWRKANQIHSWFVSHVQDGEDDCEYHNECTREILEELLDTCKTVLESCVMTVGKIQNGERLVNGKWEPIYEDGKVVIDTSVAEELLPSCSGFFFGGTGYDEWYVRDIADTIKILEEVLATTDFETQMVVYRSSW